MKNTDYIYKYIDENLKESRKKHTRGVAETAVELAKVYKADVDKAYFAAMCHDMAKNMNVDEMNDYVNKHSMDRKYLNNPNIAHGKIACMMLREDFDVEDEDILNAVSYHTTGRAGMSLLEKIIYLADAIEPGRDYPGVSELRKASREDLDKACLLSFKRTIDYLTEKGSDIDGDTLAAKEYLEKTGEKMNNRDLAQLGAELLSNKKATEVKIIDIGEKSSFADFLVIANGNSERQVAALTDDVEDAFAKEGVIVKRIEGKNGTGWVLMDFGDVIVNIFTKEMRNKYNIEKVWGDCTITDVEE